MQKLTSLTTDMFDQNNPENVSVYSVGVLELTFVTTGIGHNSTDIGWWLLKPNPRTLFSCITVVAFVFITGLQICKILTVLAFFSAIGHWPDEA